MIGVPHEEMGEEVKAVIQLVPGVEGTPELERELIGHVRERIAGYKTPRSVDFVEELPRTPTGKLVKGELRERYWPAQARPLPAADSSAVPFDPTTVPSRGPK